MSIATQTARAFATVHRNLAQMQGMAASADGNTLFAGQSAAVIGVYGAPIGEVIPQIGGGYRRRTTIPLRIARSRLAAPPPEKTKLTRTDIMPEIVYVIDRVDRQDPIDWVFYLVNFTQ